MKMETWHPWRIGWRSLVFYAHMLLSTLGNWWPASMRTNKCGRGGVPNEDDDEMKKPKSRNSIKTLLLSLFQLPLITCYDENLNKYGHRPDKYLRDNLVICEKGNDVIAVRVRRHQTTPRIFFLTKRFISASWTSAITEGLMCHNVSLSTSPLLQASSSKFQTLLAETRSQKLSW